MYINIVYIPSAFKTSVLYMIDVELRCACSYPLQLGVTLVSKIFKEQSLFVRAKIQSFVSFEVPFTCTRNVDTHKTYTRMYRKSALFRLFLAVLSLYRELCDLHKVDCAWIRTL